MYCTVLYLYWTSMMEQEPPRPVGGRSGSFRVPCRDIRQFQN